jgi:5-methylthioadenosine/S-adenosylhomocysteine deaminase
VTDSAHDLPRPDLAIINATALVDAAHDRTSFAPGTTLEITGGRITSIRPTSDGPSNAAEVIDAHGQVLMPGLVNTHAHAAMTFLRGSAEDVTVVLPTWNVPVTLTVPENVYVPVGVAEPVIGM